MRKKSNVVVHKYIDDLAESQNNINFNDLNKESEETKMKVDGDAYNTTADKIEVHNDDEKEENEHIKMYEEDHNNILYKNVENEDEDEDNIYCVSIVFIFIIF